MGLTLKCSAVPPGVRCNSGSASFLSRLWPAKLGCGVAVFCEAVVQDIAAPHFALSFGVERRVAAPPGGTSPPSLPTVPLGVCVPMKLVFFAAKGLGPTRGGALQTSKLDPFSLLRMGRGLTKTWDSCSCRLGQLSWPKGGRLRWKVLGFAPIPRRRLSLIGVSVALDRSRTACLTTPLALEVLLDVRSNISSGIVS